MPVIEAVWRRKSCKYKHKERGRGNVPQRAGAAESFSWERVLGRAWLRKFPVHMGCYSSID